MSLPDSSFIFDYVKIDSRNHLGPHRQFTWELTCIVKGCATRTVAGSSATASPGEVVLIPPETEHNWTFPQSYSEACAITICFSTDLLRAIKSLFSEMADVIDAILGHESAVVYNGEVCEKLRRLMMSMVDMPQSARVPRFLELLSGLASACCERLGAEEVRSQTEVRMDRLRILCECNFERQLRLTDVARQLSMNKSALCRMIRHQKGQTFTEYLNSLRLQHAALNLKNSSKSVSEVAFEAGFSSVSYFNRLFRRYFNLSPTEYRREPLARH